MSATYTSKYKGKEIDSAVQKVNEVIPDLQTQVSKLDSAKADKIEVPQKTSDLKNDSAFVTSEEVNEKFLAKVDKEDGKGLSSNDYTDEDKEAVQKISDKEDLSNKITDNYNPELYTYPNDVYVGANTLMSWINAHNELLTNKTAYSNYGTDPNMWYGGSEEYDKYLKKVYYSAKGTHEYVEDYVDNEVLPYVDEKVDDIKESLTTVYRLKGSAYSVTSSIIKKPSVGDVVNCANDMEISGTEEFADTNNTAYAIYSSSSGGKSAIYYYSILLPTDLQVYAGATFTVTGVDDPSITVDCVVTKMDWDASAFRMYVDVDFGSIFGGATKTKVTLSNLANNKIAVKAGDNIVYTQFGWDNLHSSVDLSEYAMKTEAITEATGQSYDFDTAPVKYHYYDKDLIVFENDKQAAIRVAYARMAQYDWDFEDIRTKYVRNIDLTEYKTEIANTYATKTEVSDDIQTLAERVHYYGDGTIEPTDVSEFNYTVNDDGVVIDSYTGSSETVVVPYKIDGVLVTGVSGKSFYQNDNIKSVILPNSITTIDESAFSYASNLTSIILPDSITSLGKLSFSACYKLEKVTLSHGLTAIPDMAFVSCKSLTSITIPDGVTSIGPQAFDFCTNLRAVTIPKSVTSIDESAFWGTTDEGKADAVFYVEQGSYAEEYCIKKGFTYKYTEIEADVYAKKDEVVEIVEATLDYPINVEEVAL